MVITSMDINNKEFKKSLRGYDCDEVDEFLDKISEDYEIIYKENSSLKEKIEILEERLKHYAQIEENIQKTLLLAQTAAEQARTAAQNESELLIRQANESAQKIIDKAHNDVIKIQDNYEAMKQEFLKFRAQFKGFMNAQLDTFNSLEKEFMKNYNVGSAVEVSDIVKPKEIENESLEENEQVDDDLDSIKSFFVKDN
ncbi:DivIVA domain-containing protein [Clostridium sp.]|jgi:cell division initiation protein|uniref:DivIVA domain-containing protein n=1 Tax=Clostridium sp. TaxID=1506 RepID=UPI0039F4CCF1